MKQLKVDAIKNGTVIDHIPGGKGVQVMKILNGCRQDPVSMGMNLPSSKFGKKDILKIENHELNPEDVNRIAIIAPTATITIIREFEVQEKWVVRIPMELKNIVHCPNPNCITNKEELPTKFDIEGSPANGSGEFMCHYCEKIYNSEELKIKAG
ncbi:MAG: aspartate carbamoyltransferase regulatory subunit [Spirochaetales bacterium]|nr:aspartate carbamoyltransferase regulatory subunit [Spirochaetales bacterium]